MSLFVDFAGLNTLIQDALTSSQNHIGYPLGSDVSAYYNPHFSLSNNGNYLHENPLSRYQIANNVFSFVVSPSPETIRTFGTDQNQIEYITSRYGELRTFDEVPITSKYFPLRFLFGVGIDNERIENKEVLSIPNIERVLIKSSFANEIDYFVNEDINNYYGLSSVTEEDYEKIKEFYLDGGLDADGSPITTFEFLKYREIVFPREINTYKTYVRQRPNYQNNFWRSTRAERQSASTKDNGFGNNVTQSIWYMDAEDNFETMSTVELGITASNGTGILQNQYTHFSYVVGPGNKPGNMGSGPIYNRRHAVPTTASVVSPLAMPIPETASAAGLGPLFQGSALWEAGVQSGKNPFYSSYNDFASDFRGAGKSYSVVPEFRMSQHIVSLLNSGSLTAIPDLFEITGGLSGATDSTTQEFYETYSTSDFLKHFAKIKKDHNDFIDPSVMTLRCKAIKKFLAYDSFYPQQRTGDIAKQFYDSYGDFIDVYQAAGAFPGSANIGKQPFFDPLIAPGVLFNSIKSGIACDYPIMLSGALSVEESGSFYGISDQNSFDYRVPFEALLKPGAYLAGKSLIFNEPHPSGTFLGVNPKSQWNGKTKNDLYLRMISNFLAEVPEFFLENQSFSTLASLPQSDPNFGNAVAGREYVMRLRLYSTTISGSGLFTPIVGEDKLDSYGAPQDLNNKQDVIMYSRPSAFGPAVASGRYANNIHYDSRDGFNPCYTPPYYYGEAWIDYKFTATETKKYSASEIINNLSASAIRFDSDEMTAFVPGGIAFDEGTLEFTGPARDSSMDPFYQLNSWGPSEVKYPLNVSSMQLFASVNDRGLGKIEATNEKNNTIVLPDSNIISTDRDSPETRWVIQTKFETPILNFKDVDLTVSPIGAQTPRGMWHQYGVLPNYNEGIYLQTTKIPHPWLKQKLGDSTTWKLTGSLLDLCGFSNDPAKIGQVAGSKTIAEAVVAVPFIEVSGVKKFFEISQENYNNSKKFFQAVDIVNKGGNPDNLGLGNPEFWEERAGASIIDQVRKMKKFVFPPTMDFVNNEDITPFSMYIFEFTHALGQQDLADIWQGVPPTIGNTFDTSEASISHPLLANELLGFGDGRDKTVTGGDVPTKLRWMVFKVKQRANTNYFDKIVNVKGTNQRRPKHTKVISDKTKQDLISYNWPYDFFSLVELVKIDAEVTFSDIKVENNTTENVVKGNEKREKSSRTINQNPTVKDKTRGRDR
jgi:hypothetical protein